MSRTELWNAVERRRKEEKREQFHIYSLLLEIKVTLMVEEINTWLNKLNKDNKEFGELNKKSK